MKNITIFTIPKPFTDQHINVIQTNAIKSWIQLGVEVVLVGDDKGVKEKADELGARHIADVACNEFGTPLLNSAFNLVRKRFNNEYLVYINADIILLKDFLNVFEQVENIDEFLVVGQRYMLGVNDELKFNGDWERGIRNNLHENGFLHQARAALDYFIFRNRSFQNIPAFAVGRICWDNWMIYEARRKKMLTIEVRDIITPIHQKHDRIVGINDYDNRLNNPEAQNNLRLAGGRKHVFNLNDANYILDNNGLRPKKFSYKQLIKYIKKAPEVLKFKIFWITLNFVFRGFRSIGKRVLPENLLGDMDYQIAGRYKRIYFYHIRKTGGTSLNHSFFALCGDNYKIYSRLAKSKKYSIKCGDKIFAGWNGKLVEKGKYFYSFSHVPAHKLNLPPKTFKITIMRDPVNRVLSHYKMLLHYKEYNIDHKCMEIEEKWLGNSFSDFLERIPIKNLMNQLYMFSDNFNVEDALINIRKCDHVFFTEGYAKGLKELSEKLKLDLKSFNEKKAQNKFEPQEEELLKLRKLLKKELIFYKKVKEIFN